MGKWEAVSKIQPTNNRLESSSNTINNREKIVSQLSINCDPDNQPIRRLFTEQNLKVDTDILEEENPSTPAPDGVTEQQEEDIKPILDEFQSTTTTQQPVFFEKQKATTQAQPRQKA
ncbi:hypothetical protein KEM48_004945 [Puccinia striiformis f. sp. tritici PST-130]|uniref:Uncharacterized protein n=1 Tax=Puccinia striiformis f. sp. tritici PST-78 TaxID=1165861 RepID=A0A0L0UV10_9BASI|nr:hypothetical protein Pst134EB_008284 [Puccinia striiformis f. sp. tritici]KAI9608527.1 hypothetical protein H4Q26_004710 [Puccinia striiformis f. sp. tritici PST-130]KAI9617156.1 hypothetical protein KEM48_004945 [Puccinia striiformis f. sp. tritici PST-130]KNE90868.1 hypothetical protein PSTG_15690 [Puccinia striiformis f. sp. tritici PST-78]